MATVYWPSRNPVVTEEAGTRGGSHYGIDLAAQLGDPVIAPFDGVAVYVGGDGATGRLWLGNGWLYPNGEGKTVDIRRADGLVSRVGHLSGYAIQPGQSVKAGQVIGYAGSTGYSTGVHIHWELRWDRAWSGGSWINPRSVNPITYVPHNSTAPKPPLHGMDDAMIVYYKNAQGKGKPGWLILGYTPNPLILSTQRAANQWAAKIGSALTTDSGGFEKYLLAAGGTAAQVAKIA